MPYYDIIFKLVKQNCLIYRPALNILTKFSKSCPCYITHPTKHSIVWGVTTPPPLSLLPLSSPLFFHLSIILFHTNSFFWSSQLRKIVKNLLQNKWFTQAVKKGSSSFPFSLFQTSSLMYTHTLYLSAHSWSLFPFLYPVSFSLFFLYCLFFSLFIVQTHFFSHSFCLFYLSSFLSFVSFRLISHTFKYFLSSLSC